MNMYVTKNPSTKGPGMELPNCDDHPAVKKFWKQLHFEVNMLLSSRVESAKTVSENVARLVNLAKDLKGSYAEFEKSKAEMKTAEKNFERTARRKHAYDEHEKAKEDKISAHNTYETQLAKMFSLVVDYIDCRSQLLFAIDGEVNYRVPDTIPAINIEELFATGAPAKVA